MQQERKIILDLPDHIAQKAKKLIIQFEKSDIAAVEEINTKIACLQQSLHEIGISGNPRKEYEIEEKLIELNKSQ